MTLQRRMLLAIGYVLLVAIVAFEVPLAVNTSNRVDSEVRAQASAQADLLSVAAAEELSEGRRLLQGLVTVAAETVRGRVLIVDARGRLVADSEGESTGTDFSSRPEIVAALTGEKFQEQRPSNTLGMEIIATSAPMLAGDDLVGAVRITQSAEAKGRATLDAIAGLVLIGLIVLAIGLLAALAIARQLAEPMRALTASAEAIAGGELDERAPVEGSSEQQALAQAFNRMTDQLAAALARQREFVADASHQLRTPLAGLRLRIEEARATRDETGRASQADATIAELDAAMAEVDRLSGIVGDMLTLSRIGERETPLTTVDLDGLAASAVERWRAEAERRGLSIIGSGSARASVICSAEDAGRALDALVENALRYSPPGSVVEIHSRPGTIEVRDQGPGLSEDEIEKVFDRFHRGSAGHAGETGTGLGLPIARSLAREWGGDVKLENASPRGLRATLSFRSR